MANTITHQGIVENTDGSHVYVRIIQTSACSACSAKGHCSSADRKEKIIEVFSPLASFKSGDSVTIVGQTSMGLSAVLLAFFLPFLLLVCSLFLFVHLLHGNELLSGVFSLSLLIPYYFIIWLKRDKLKNKFSFTIQSN